MFPVYGGKCLSRKVVTTKLRNFLKDVQKLQMMKRKFEIGWDSSQKTSCAADFDALIKRWDKFIHVGGEYTEK
jgi:hypothetical protein